MARRLFGLSAGALAVASLAAGPAAAQSELPDALVARHAAEPMCQPRDELPHGEEWEIHPLTDGFVLYMVPCAAGAYNLSYMFYVGPDDREAYARQLFVDFSGRYGWTGTDQLFNPAFDGETLTLTSFYKGRGLADCGTSGVWRWDQYAFALQAFYAQDECNGTVEPGDFPQVWPAD